MFASREAENRKNPVSREESESYDRMLARMAAERAG
jgi:dsDNA-binding SOS-regulon protein